MYLPADTPRIMVLSAKGGCGKTTISTSLAGYYARQGDSTTLVDFDCQGSSMRWLSVRDGEQPIVHGVPAFDQPKGVTSSWQYRIPPDTRRIVIDTPAGVRGHQLADLIRLADTVLIPVLPSHIDIHALSRFIEELLVVGKLRNYDTRVGIVANRVKERTKVFAGLQRFLKRLDFPFVGHLRETQNYVQAQELGVGIHELTNCRVQKDVAQWDSLVTWLGADMRDTGDRSANIRGWNAGRAHGVF